MEHFEEVNNPRYEQYKEKIKSFRLLDDDFMKVVFAHDKTPAQTTIRIIMGKPDLVVERFAVEDVKHNLRGHSVRLDVHAVDEQGKHYDIEIQRSDQGAGAKRARYNMSLLDASNLDCGVDYEHLPEAYVIFITENDVFNAGLPLYHIDRHIKELGKPFPDGGHIIYANSTYVGDDDVGKLMHDFRTSDPHNMFFKELSVPATFYKENPKGVEHMSRVMETIAEEVAEKTMLASIQSLIKTLRLSPKQAMDALEVPEKDQAKYQAMLQ